VGAETGRGGNDSLTVNCRFDSVTYPPWCLESRAVCWATAAAIFFESMMAGSAAHRSVAARAAAAATGGGVDGSCGVTGRWPSRAEREPCPSRPPKNRLPDGLERRARGGAQVARAGNRSEAAPANTSPGLGREGWSGKK
jgi:hypothetical protein